MKILIAVGVSGKKLLRTDSASNKNARDVVRKIKEVDR
jgi:hypothetical protein